jgi:hypothetical protein
MEQTNFSNKVLIIEDQYAHFKKIVEFLEKNNINSIELYKNQNELNEFFVLNNDFCIEHVKNNIRQIIEKKSNKINAIILDLYLDSSENDFSDDCTGLAVRNFIRALDIDSNWSTNVPIILLSRESINKTILLKDKFTDVFVKDEILDNSKSEQIKFLLCLEKNMYRSNNAIKEDLPRN